MTWTLETSCGHESRKIASIAVPYLRGRLLDVGCGMEKVWPTAIGIDNGHHFGRGAADIEGDGTDLAMFADGSMDAVFSSHTLEHFPKERVPSVLAEWARVLKVGGNLVLYIPSGNLYPRMGEPGANPDHRWDPMPGDVEAMLRDMDGWELLESEERGDTDEYSLFIVARKRGSGWVENVWQRNPGGKKRCLVIRYGAIGDAIQTAGVFPAIKKQGYHLTVNTAESTYDLLKHDPNVDEWIVQAKDFVPNEQLGPYWETIAQRYDRVINLCESVEKALLTVPGTLTHQYPDDVRRDVFGRVNYLERTAQIAGVPLSGCRPRFFATEAERDWAESVRREARGAPVIAWALHGSAPHKLYPWTQVVLAWLTKRSPCHVWLLGDGLMGPVIQDGIINKLIECEVDVSRIHGMAGKWSVREGMVFAQSADCVVGPETGPLNVVSHEPTAKVIYLSHSSHENLTRDWVNTTVLEPNRGRAPCFPCHRLHSDWSYCPRDETTSAALCAASIAPERVFEAIALATGARRRAA